MFRTFVEKYLPLNNFHKLFAPHTMSDTKPPPGSPSDSGSDKAAEAMIEELQERLCFVLDPVGYEKVSNKVVAQLARLGEYYMFLQKRC